MRYSTKALADDLMHEIREYVAHEIGELRSHTAAASRVGSLMLQVDRLEARVAELERAAKSKSQVIKLAA
jgi:hypothetical protein